MNIAHTSNIPLGRAVYLPKAIASVQLGMCSIEDVVRLVISSCLVPARRPAWSCHHPLPPPPPPQALVPGNWIHEREAGSIHLYTPYLTYRRYDNTAIPVIRAPKIPSALMHLLQHLIILQRPIGSAKIPPTCSQSNQPISIKLLQPCGPLKAE